MDEKFNKTIILTLIITGIIFTVIGSTFAFFAASTAGNGDNISGGTYVFDVNLDVSVLKSGKLIPVSDNLIIQTLNSTHVCEDTRGYGLCTLFRIRFTNSGTAQTMTGTMKTINSTYTTSNLKYQLFTLSGNTYTAISSAASVNNTANATNNFKLNTTDVMVSLADGTISDTTTDVYLAIWVSDPGSNQLEDQNKVFTGQLTFNSMAGDRINSSFITS